MAEIPPLTWDENDLAFAVELIEEADGIMQDVNTGLKRVGENPAVLLALSGNVRRIHKGKKPERVSVRWPELA